MAEITYCDDYEAITGKAIPAPDAEQPAEAPVAPETPVIETKVVDAPETPAVAPATVAEVQ